MSEGKLLQVSLRDRSNIMTVAGYWSVTYDVLAVIGEGEDDYHVAAIAEFKSRDDAHAYCKNTTDAFAVRPPDRQVNDAVDWISNVVAFRTEGLTFKR